MDLLASKYWLHFIEFEINIGCTQVVCILLLLLSLRITTVGLAILVGASIVSFIAEL
jgi:hypothetical protein